MSKIDDLFNEIVREDVPQGPARLRVIDTPTIQQLQAIPVGSDVIISDDSNFMSGLWTQGIIDDLTQKIERSACPHLHAYVAYLPPQPTPETSRTARDIAIEIIRDYGGDPHATDDESVRNRVAIERAVHQAREGMVFTPF